jgi:tripartite-type tricarboxylate transporter receptor subunit TctC
MKRAVLIVSLLSLGLASGPAFTADPYPAKPIKIVAPFPPGGAADIVSRQLAAALSSSLGQPVVVENRPGASGNIAGDYVAKSQKDGHTLLLATSASQGINVALFKTMPYDVVRDLQPISMVGTLTTVLVVNSQLPAMTAKELVELARTRPGGLKYASAGPGSGAHLVAEWFSNVAGIRMLHVPYKGDGPGTVALLAGEVDLQFALVTATLPQIKAGKLRPLAVATGTRSAQLPDVPTLGEAGYPVLHQTWVALMAPSGTPRAVIDLLNREVIKALSQPDLRARMSAGGTEPLTSSPEELAAAIRAEIAKWTPIVKLSGATVE